MCQLAASKHCGGIIGMTKRNKAPVAACLALTGLLAGCAPFAGFPDDPAARSSLKAYYGPDSETGYNEDEKDETVRTAARNRIVRQRLYGYDLEYSDFKRGLATQGNAVSVGGGLAVLTMAGLAATTGHAATSAALAAAASGVIGAQGLINKELYFQKTLPALVAQMDAARDRVIAKILDGIGLPDSQYPLVRANVDLARLKDAGSIESAIGTIGEEANAAKKVAANAVTTARDATYVMTRVPRQSVQQRIAKLSDTDIVKLANTMLPDFDGRPAAVKADATLYRPAVGAQFLDTQALRARQFLSFWVDGETMSPDRLIFWTSKLNAL